jgi:drug/metabolite transporter superfamily protein YnfA
MDTMSSISQGIRKSRSIQIELARITAISTIILFILSGVMTVTAGNFATWISYRDQSIALLCLTTLLIILFISVIVLRLRSLRKSQNAKAIFSGGVQIQPKFLAIGSVMDEPWQLLYHMRNTPNPMAVKTNLIRYLISSMQSHISRSRQIGR